MSHPFVGIVNGFDLTARSNDSFIRLALFSVLADTPPRQIRKRKIVPLRSLIFLYSNNHPQAKGNPTRCAAVACYGRLSTQHFRSSSFMQILHSND